MIQLVFFCLSLFFVLRFHVCESLATRIPFFGMKEFLLVCVSGKNILSKGYKSSQFPLFAEPCEMRFCRRLILSVAIFHRYFQCLLSMNKCFLPRVPCLWLQEFCSNVTIFVNFPVIAWATEICSSSKLSLISLK